MILDSTGFLPGETGLSNLLLLASIRGKAGREEAEETMRRVGLKPESKVAAGKYSQGMKQRLAIAQALMEKPSLLVLDEPLNAIDLNSVGKFRKLFKELNEKEGVTILLTSHYSQDIEELCRNTYDINLLRTGSVRPSPSQSFVRQSHITNPVRPNTATSLKSLRGNPRTVLY